MTLRCLLYSADEGTAAPILQVLTGLGVEGEHCSDAVATVDKVSHQDFQIVIIDWDNQPEAGLLLSAARERKAAERPLTLAIVSDDVSVPQALQAGANSILRKPILANQVRDTLTTARDLLRSKRESAANAAQAAAAGPAPAIPQSIDRRPLNSEPIGSEPRGERTLRAGEFLQSGPTAPGAQFETEADVSPSHEIPSAHPVDPLTELEPMAAAMAHAPSQALPALDPPPAPPAPEEPRGLEWYKKTRGGASAPAASEPPSAPARPIKPELVDYEQPAPPANAETPSAPTSLEDLLRRSRAAKASLEAQEPKPEPSLGETRLPKFEQPREAKKEPELFGYISGESNDSEKAARPRFRFKGPILAAGILAACAVAAAPQAPWHPQVKMAWTRGQQRLHAWLNPQLVTATVQAPPAHEDFGRAGDEYKVPVAETIPDATTDPSQIQVLPVVDPTVKKTDPMGANAEVPPAPADATAASPVEQPPTGSQSTDPPPTQAPPTTSAADGGSSVSGGSSATPISNGNPTSVATSGAQSHSDTPALVAPPVAPPYQPPQSKVQPSHYVPGPAAGVPSSLKSQIASSAPEASGNKPVEAALPSIEPVSVSEAAARGLLTDQPAMEYPVSAKGQSGTVVLQVLIGRDGTVQDAKFMQGSLAFAKSATEGVKQWKFKPYLMNGRAASVQTTLTIGFKP